MDPGTIVFESPKFRVQRRHVRLPDGRTHAFDIIRHPGAAVILPILDDGSIVLIGNYRVAVDCELLELPAGTFDPGESALECARRELTEETGYRAGCLAPLVSFYSSPGILDEKMEVFVARDLTPGPAELDAGEQIRLVPLTLADALAAIRDGRVPDGKTILSLLYYERFARS